MVWERTKALKMLHKHDQLHTMHTATTKTPITHCVMTRYNFTHPLYLLFKPPRRMAAQNVQHSQGKWVSRSDWLQFWLNPNGYLLITVHC